MRLFAGNLPWSIDDDELRNLFSAYGEIADCKIIMDRETGRSRGFGFVEMDESAAQAAIEALNGTEIDGRNIKVNEAEERRDRGPGGGGGHGGGHRGGGGGGGGGGYGGGGGGRRY
jgi:cold-inducible RNA-binding protein